MATIRKGANVDGLKIGARIGQPSGLDTAGKKAAPHQRNDSFEAKESGEIPEENADFSLARKPLSFWALS